MQLSPAEQFRTPLKMALFAQKEELFNKSLFEREELTKIFSGLKRSLSLLTESPVKSLEKRLISSGKTPREQLRTSFSLLENFYKALCAYGSKSEHFLSATFCYASLAAYLRSTGLNFSLAEEEGFWDQTLPYEELEKLPEWPDYISHFYSPTLSASLMESHLLLSKKIREQLSEKNSVRLVLIDLSTIIKYKILCTEIERLLKSPLPPTTGIEVALHESDQSNTTGRNLEDVTGKELDELRKRHQQIDTFLEADNNAWLSEVLAAPQTEFDVGHYLAKFVLIVGEPTWGYSNRIAATFARHVLMQEIEGLFPKLSQATITKLRALPQLLARRYPDTARNLEFGFERRSSGRLRAVVGKSDQLLGDLKEWRRRAANTALSSEQLDTLIKRASTAIKSGERERALHFRKGMIEAFLSAHLRDSINEYQELLLLRIQRCSDSEQRQALQLASDTPHRRKYQMELLLRAQSLMASLLPDYLPPHTPSARREKQPSPPVTRSKKSKSTNGRKQKRKLTKKTKPAKTPLPRPPVLPSVTIPEEVHKEDLSPPPSPSPERSAPPTVEEARRLAELAQVPLRIRRHPRTYARPEFVGDRRNEVLHYLPPQLTQMLLLKKDPFIEKYALHLAQDPHFAGNQSVSATALCHDREMGRVYVGELKIGMTPEGLVYHVYLNPYTNPLGGRETLEQSMIHYPPADLREAEEGFTPVGRCQMRYNKPLRTVDLLDVEKNCLYRLFERRER